MSAGNRKYPYRPTTTPAQEKNAQYLYILVLIVIVGILIGALIA